MINLVAVHKFTGDLVIAVPRIKGESEVLSYWIEDGNEFYIASPILFYHDFKVVGDLDGETNEHIKKFYRRSEII